MKNSLYRQERLIEKLLKFRWKKHRFDLIKVEVYDRYDGDKFVCRVECFKGGRGIKSRVMKHESFLGDDFVTDAENKLIKIITLEHGKHKIS